MRHIRSLDRVSCMLLVLLALAIVLPSTASGADHTKVVTVRCDKGETIGHALEAHDGPLTIETHTNPSVRAESDRRFG